MFSYAGQSQERELSQDTKRHNPLPTVLNSKADHDRLHGELKYLSPSKALDSHRQLDRVGMQDGSYLPLRTCASWSAPRNPNPS